MIPRLLVLIFVCVSLARGNPAAGKPWHWKSPKPLLEPNGPPRNSRIVGGTEAVPHAWPHQVALFIDNLYFCGGSLISDEWVMTAAHCTDGAGFVDVVMGAHNIQVAEPEQVTVTSTDFFVHENWDSFNLQNDISLIRLPSPVQFNENITSISLASTDPPPGTIVTPTGWGRPSDSTGSISDVLRQVDVPILDIPACQDYYNIVTGNMICIDSTGGKGTCNGDSGGPLFNGGVTVGITSFGSSTGCETGYPDGFTRVSSYLDWIFIKTGITP
ncbi:hypothetical protein SK128_021709 [Halocaridina rubra]|uniref:Peptidase S1 domain-containing protein n=1 Tax=Halocaridina rubra TaxID=373956 RepID=A0AAN9A1U1_HALRR